MEIFRFVKETSTLKFIKESPLIFSGWDEFYDYLYEDKIIIFF